MAIKAIAMDIDGTLTNDQKVISPRTREKLLAAQESGIKLILASGRPAFMPWRRSSIFRITMACWWLLMARMWSMLRPTRCCLTRPCQLTSCTACSTTCATLT